jgi:ATP:corrinoid adenosyltransferase
VFGRLVKEDDRMMMQKHCFERGVRNTTDNLQIAVFTEVNNAFHDYHVKLSEVEQTLQRYHSQSKKIRKGGKNFPKDLYDLKALGVGINKRKARVESMLAEAVQQK